MALPSRDRALLLLPARIREGFCDGPLRKIERVGKRERHKVAGKTSELSDTFVEKLFHLAWDVDRVPYRFHKQFRVASDRLCKEITRSDPRSRKSSAATIPIAREITRITFCLAAWC